jgi:hypothetical protein
MNYTEQTILAHSNVTSHIADAVVNGTANHTNSGGLLMSQIVTAFEPMVANGYIQNSLNFFFFGTILETGRRLWQWIMDRFTGGFVLTPIFDSCDPAYEWFFCIPERRKDLGDDTRVPRFCED